MCLFLEFVRPVSAHDDSAAYSAEASTSAFPFKAYHIISAVATEPLRFSDEIKTKD
jgi:hypothetical protein